jgi:hypothetical protein
MESAPSAVTDWVSRVDEAVVQCAQDVGILLRRSDLVAAIEALAAAEFIHRPASGLGMFLDGPKANARDAVRIVFADEHVRPGYPLRLPPSAHRTVAERARDPEG